MSDWKLPPKAKIYEALSAVGDKRIEIIDAQKALVTSSDGKKTYTVQWSSDGSEIMSNDNASFWQGYLGYPIIAVLFLTERLYYAPAIATKLAGINWKHLNTKYKNKYEMVIDIVLSNLDALGVETNDIDSEVTRIMAELEKLSLKKLSVKTYPPK